MKNSFRALTFLLLTALALLAAPAHFPKSEAASAPAGPMTYGQSAGAYRAL